MNKAHFEDWFENYLTTEDKVEIWNAYQRETFCDDEIYENNEYFFNEFFSSADEAVRAVCFGDYHYNDRWVWFNGYGNLESSDFIDDQIDIDEMFDFYEEHPDMLDRFKYYEEDEEEEEENED